MPCPGYFVDLGIDQDFARARELLKPLGDLRKEMVLAAGLAPDSIFLIAPDQQTAFAVANRLKLHNEPACFTNDQFQTFVTAD